MLLVPLAIGTYLVQYHDGADVEADIVIGEFRVSLHSDISRFQHKQLKSSGVVKRIIKSRAYKKFSEDKVQNNPKNWGTDRIDSRKGLDRKHIYPSSAGAGSTAYILDTGLNTKHLDFEGRADFGFDAVDEGPEDLDGHGTHCAGIIGSKTYGVAKKAKLIGVKVLNREGEGSDIQILKGLEWVVKDVRRNRRKGVINMSLGGEYSEMLNDAIKETVRMGINVIAAAGNENVDACSGSPSSAEYAITVGSVDENDKKSSFSNWGECVNLFAPGRNIKSTFIGHRNMETAIKSGTSMAAPHVTGIAALYLSENIRPGQIRQKIMEFGTYDVIRNLEENTNNILAYNHIEKQNGVSRRIHVE